MYKNVGHCLYISLANGAHSSIFLMQKKFNSDLKKQGFLKLQSGFEVTLRGDLIKVPILRRFVLKYGCRNLRGCRDIKIRNFVSRLLYIAAVVYPLSLSL